MSLWINYGWTTYFANNCNNVNKIKNLFSASKNAAINVDLRLPILSMSLSLELCVWFAQCVWRAHPSNWPLVTNWFCWLITKYTNAVCLFMLFFWIISENCGRSSLYDGKSCTACHDMPTGRNKSTCIVFFFVSFFVMLIECKRLCLGSMVDLSIFKLSRL